MTFRLYASASFIISSISHGIPPKCRRMTAFVLAVTDFSISAALAFNVLLSTSHRTSFAPLAHTAFPAPTKLTDGTITSSPGCIPHKCIDEKSPSLQQCAVTRCSFVLPMYSANFSSNSIVSFPLPIQLDSNTCEILSSSSFPRDG